MKNHIEALNKITNTLKEVIDNARWLENNGTEKQIEASDARYDKLVQRGVMKAAKHMDETSYLKSEFASITITEWSEIKETIIN